MQHAMLHALQLQSTHCVVLGVARCWMHCIAAALSFPKTCLMEALCAATVRTCLGTEAGAFFRVPFFAALTAAGRLSIALLILVNKKSCVYTSVSSIASDAAHPSCAPRHTSSRTARSVLVLAMTGYFKQGYTDKSSFAADVAWHVWGAGMCFARTEKHK